MELFSEEVSRETSKYLDLVLKWNNKINLISKKDVGSIFQRHLSDSAQLYQLIIDKKSKISDLGSGGGFPGVVLSIMGCQNMHLIEIDERKAVFLREVKRQLSLNCTVVNSDINSISEKYDLCISRGLGSLKLLLGFAVKLLNENGYCLFLKGQNVDSEIVEAEKYFKFDLKKHPSITNQNGVILELINIKFKNNE